MIKFSKFVVMLIFLMKLVTTGEARGAKGAMAHPSFWKFSFTTTNFLNFNHNILAPPPPSKF